MNGAAKRLLPAGLIALALHTGFLCWRFNMGQDILPTPQSTKRIAVSLGIQKIAEPKPPAAKQPMPFVEKKITPAEHAKAPQVPLAKDLAVPTPLTKKNLAPTHSKQKKQRKTPPKKQVVQQKRKVFQETSPPSPPSRKKTVLPQQPPASSIVEQQAPQAQLAPKETKGMIKARPLYRRNAKPKYPSRARQRGWQGTVLLEVEVLADGSAGQVTLYKSSGYKLLDKTGLSAVKKWRFIPGMVNGTLQTMKVIVPLHFTLK